MTARPSAGASWRAVAVAVALVAGSTCDSPTGLPDPGDASYAVVYDPGRLVYATLNCDRFVTHAVLSLGRRDRGFGLSVNLHDDCTRAGGGFAFWEVLILGRYAVSDSTLTFTPEAAGDPEFPGTFDARYVRVTLPARADSLAPTPIPMELGPRHPF